MTEDEKLKFEYETTLENWRMLAEIRFKLLALVPTLSGIAVAILSDTLLSPGYGAGVVLVIGLIGFFVTVGVTFYDQRNSQLSNRAFFQAQELEQRLQMPLGGPLNGRPGRVLQVFGIQIWHDRALALIYSSSLAGWVFLVIWALLSLLTTDLTFSFWVSFVVSTVAAIVFIYKLHDLERQANQNPYAKNKSQTVA